MKRLLAILAFLVCALPAQAQQRIWGWCSEGGQTISIAGLSASPLAQASYPGCTVTVYITGSGGTLATIYTDSTLTTQKANPFTADTTTGYWYYYVASGHFDVQLSGAGIPSTFTLGDITITGSLSNLAGGTASTGQTYDFRSANLDIPRSAGARPTDSAGIALDYVSGLPLMYVGTNGYLWFATMLSTNVPTPVSRDTVSFSTANGPAFTLQDSGFPAATFVAAGSSHAPGFVPDPGATVYTEPRYLGDDAAFHVGINLGQNENDFTSGTAGNLTLTNANNGSSAGQEIVFVGDGPTIRAAIKVKTGSGASDVGCMSFYANGQGSNACDGQMTLTPGLSTLTNAGLYLASTGSFVPYLSIGASTAAAPNPATTGSMRFANSATFRYRNFANTLDYQAFWLVDGQVQIGDYNNATYVFSLRMPSCFSASGSCAGTDSGVVSIAASNTTVTVATGFVTANSTILVTENTTFGPTLGVTCNTTTGRVYSITAKSVGTSFTITSSAAPVTNPACLTFLIVN
jgi:hypothetical protein